MQADLENTVKYKLCSCTVFISGDGLGFTGVQVCPTYPTCVSGSGFCVFLSITFFFYSSDLLKGKYFGEWVSGTNTFLKYEKCLYLGNF